MPALNRRTAIIFCTILLVAMGYGIFIPVVPFFAKSMGASGRDLGFLTAAYAAMQFLFAPVWGDLSDRIGRRPVILFGVMGCIVSQVLYGLSTQLWMFYASRALSGALTSAVFPTAWAYIADTTTPEERSGGMGLVSAGMYTGMMFGPALGGLLANISLTLPFFVAAALSTVVLAFVFFMLPESLPAGQRKPGGRRSVGANLTQMAPALRGPLGRFFLLTFLFSFGMSHHCSIFGLYVVQRFSYTPDQVGTVMAAAGVGSALVQAFLTGRVARWWGEAAVVRGALLASAIGFLAILLAATFPTVALAACFYVMASSLLSPMVAALVSRAAGQGQGAAMGLNSSFMSLGQIIGPIWAGYALDLSYKLPFLSGATVMALGWAITIVWGRAAGRGQRAHAAKTLS